VRTFLSQRSIAIAIRKTLDEPKPIPILPPVLNPGSVDCIDAVGAGASKEVELVILAAADEDVPCGDDVLEELLKVADIVEIVTVMVDVERGPTLLGDGVFARLPLTKTTRTAAYLYERQ
jgi:hypothetical protein